jgi:hypothetical protein
MLTMLNRGASLLVAAGHCYLFATRAKASAYGVAVLAVYPIVCLGLLWYGDVVGEVSGYIGHGALVDAPTPGCLVALFGWFLLLGLPLLVSLTTHHGMWSPSA